MSVAQLQKQIVLLQMPIGIISLVSLQFGFDLFHLISTFVYTVPEHCTLLYAIILYYTQCPLSG